MACSVVTQECRAPANLVPERTPRTRCFACGEPVCAECSRRRFWYGYGSRRVCRDCEEDHGG